MSPYLVLQMQVRPRAEKESETAWSNWERGEVKLKTLCEARVIGGRLKQWPCNACNTKKFVPRDMLFGVLEYRVLLSQNRTFGSVYIAKKKEIKVSQ